MRLQTNRSLGRPGTIVPMLALGLMGLLGMIALAVDIGVIAIARTQAQGAADIAALTGARLLDGEASTSYNIANSANTAKTAATNNKILGTPVTTSQVTVKTGVYKYDAGQQKFIADPTTFTTATSGVPGGTGGSWTASQAQLAVNSPTYFARVFGVNSFNVSAQATAVHRPRDVAVILDFSGSMKYSSVANYTYSGEGVRSLNPDPNWPQFGHYSRYVGLTTTGSNPMQRTTDYTTGSGEIHSANNYTSTSDSGPAMAGSSMALGWVTLQSGSYVSAFYNPPTGAWSASATPTCTPAPDNFKDQSDSPVAYVGDKAPRIGLSASSAIAYAKNIKEVLDNGSTYSSNTHTRDAIWEQYGYDKNNQASYLTNPGFKGYSMGPGYYGKTFWQWPPDPRFGTWVQNGSSGTWYYDNTGGNAGNPNSPHATNPAKDTNGKWIADWRMRFFYYGSSHASAGQRVEDNNILFDSSGNLRTPSSSGYRVDYPAIMKWIKAGPQVFPTNLRSGRVLYYSAIPDDVASSSDLDQVFWKNYIDYVLGIAGGTSTFHGRESSSWGSGKVTARSSLLASDLTSGTSVKRSGSTRASTLGSNPAPYMQYTDNPNRPRAHMWFGPYTMLMFICDDGPGGNMSPGTCTEAQMWQLKVGVQSALEDIRKNHPNDWVSLIYFSDRSSFNTPRVKLGQDYTRMKNALWYPFTLLDNLGDTSQELRAINSSFAWQLGGNVPHAEGGTCPDMGLKLAYNEFSTASGYNGRRGAAKMVILETDGVPNATCGGTLTNSGPYLSKYGSTSSIGTTTSTSNGDSATITAALNTCQRIANMDNASGLGYSTTRVPARIHVIAFGDLFESSSSLKDTALTFLTNAQIKGNTSATGATSIESYKIITGTYTTRIDNLRTAFERIMQGGVQVTLIK